VLVLLTPGTIAVLVSAGVVLLTPGTIAVLVSAGGVLLDCAGGVLDGSFTSEVVVVLTGGVAVPGVLVVFVLVRGGEVLEAVLQSKEMVGTWMLQLGFGLSGWGG
jgi:succinyl-CoA synthetase beta subunit